MYYQLTADVRELPVYKAFAASEVCLPWDSKHKAAVIEQRPFSGRSDACFKDKQTARQIGSHTSSRTSSRTSSNRVEIGGIWEYSYRS